MGLKTCAPFVWVLMLHTFGEGGLKNSGKNYVL